MLWYKDILHMQQLFLLFIFFYSYSIVPVEVKEQVGDLMKKENYDKKQWTISISNSGAQPPTEHYHLYCNYCKTVMLPKVYEEFKDGLGSNADIVTLISNWDALKIPAKYADYIGCFLPWNKAHHAGPNSRRFIREPSEHPKSTHIFTTSAVTMKRQQKQASITSQPPQKVIMLDKSNTTTSQQTKIIGKHNKTHHFPKIDSFMTGVTVTGECTTKMAEFGKGYCLSMVHTGVNKMLSNKAIIESYTTAITGMNLSIKSQINLFFNI